MVNSSRYVVSVDMGTSSVRACLVALEGEYNIRTYPIDIFVVGGYLLEAEDPKGNADALKKAMK